MTNTERFQIIERVHTEYKGTSIDTPMAIEIAAKLIAQLIGICKEQEEQINTLMEYVTSLQASVGNSDARVSRLERIAARGQVDADQHQMD